MLLKHFTNPLFEAPLGNFHLQGFDDEPTRFRAPEMKMMKQPQYVEKLGRAFRRTPFIFDLYMDNTDSNLEGIEGEFDQGDDFSPEQDLDPEGPKNAIEQMENEFRQLLNTVPNVFWTEHGKYNEYGLIPSRSKAIRVIFKRNANPGPSKIPMTPWIVAHRIAHGIFDAVAQGEFGHDDIHPDNDVAGIRQTIKELAIELSKIARRKGKPDVLGKIIDPIDRNYSHPLYWRHMLEKLIGTFRSARDGALQDSEFLVECMAQYIIQGKVTLAGPETWMARASTENFWGQNVPITLKIALSNKRWVARTTEIIKKVETNLNDSFRSIFEHLEGATIVTI
jgi:hypothetical protein